MTGTTVRRRPLEAVEHTRPRRMGGPSRHARRDGGPRLKDKARLPFHVVWVVTFILLVIGLLMMLSLSTPVAQGDKFAFLKNQGMAAAAGVVALFIISRLDYARLRKASVAFLVIVVVSLLLVHVPGLARREGGATSYIPVGPLTYQPSEFAKLAVVLLGAHLLTSVRMIERSFKEFMMPFGLSCVAMILLVVSEHDLGTAIIIAGLMLGMLWLGGMKGSQVALITGVGFAGAAGLILTSQERIERFLSFWNPSSDPTDSSYQLTQSLIALGRGGWFGVGPGQSVQKYHYLPMARSDMVFAIFGEEFGLAGAAFVIVLFVVFALACWQLARRCDDPMGKFLIAGCGMLVTLEAVVNIGGVIGALPLTGVPLPFISYGRNSLLVMLAAVGLILSVARRARGAEVRSEGERYDNVTHLDRRRWDSGARGARAGAR